MSKKKRFGLWLNETLSDLSDKTEQENTHKDGVTLHNMTAMFGVCTHLVLLLVVSVLQLLDKLTALFKARSSLVLLLRLPL